MLFRGVRDFRTKEPMQLGADLRRLNLAIEEGFESSERDLETRLKVVTATAATYQASHGELVLAGHNQETVVLLPRSSAEMACRSVFVVRVGATFGATVVAASNQSVNGGSSLSLPSVGWQRFIDDGLGSFWGPAL